MKQFEEIIDWNEQESINGGGVVSCVAGGMAGAIIGSFVGLIPTVVTGDTTYIKQSVVACTSVGIWVGAGTPVP